MTTRARTPPSEVALRPVEPRDWALVRAWVARPDIQSWWGNATAAEAEMRLVAETGPALARIVLVAGEAVGYAHAIDAAHWGSALPTGMPPGTWDADIFIAEPAHRGRGVGEAALNQLAEEVFSTTFAVALSVFVSLANEPAIRAYERAGFQWQQVWEDPIHGPSWMMLRLRGAQ
ncbi:MAG: GNAT family N-acetyltransferase [Hyphomicrobiaceae bacterium]|nr:GNAT family N-acetyltransferase [Hyphomicrobiaceae bacterium]MCC0007216.1 GNAT family N-acetyltransferase [Hyphomicrobiaceae bacterium]